MIQRADDEACGVLFASQQFIIIGLELQRTGHWIARQTDFGHDLAINETGKLSILPAHAPGAYFFHVDKTAIDNHGRVRQVRIGGTIRLNALT